MNLAALNILKELIAYKSVTPQHAGSLDYIAKLLAEMGFIVKYIELGEGANTTANLYARYGSKKPHLCFAGHVDVVPPGDLSKWDSPPFTPTINNGIITGRGCADMKGAIAAMLDSVNKYISEGSFEGSISFLLTSDEEGDATFGTAAILEKITDIFDADFCIVGEPTSIKHVGDVIKIGRRGSINFELELYGTQGHVAYPHLADNPTKYFAPILSDLLSLQLDNGSEFFEASHLEITSIDVGNNISNIIPGKISCTFNIRFNDLHNEENLYQQIQKIIECYTINYELKYKCSSHSFLSGSNQYTELLCKATEQVLGRKAQYATNGGTSDARFIKNYCPIAELGFLSTEAHKVNEHIKISDLQKLRDVYYIFLENFF